MRTALLTLLLLASLPGIAAANGYEIYPAPLTWSHDSTTLAACLPESWPPGHTFTTLRLYDARGNSLAELISDLNVSSPSFDTDGSLWAVVDGRLVYFDLQAQVNAQPADAPHPVLDCTVGPDNHPYFSVGQRFYGAEIYRQLAEFQDDPAMARVRYEQLTVSGTSASAVAPVLSRDGLKMFYPLQDSSSEEAYERLWMYDFDLGQARRLTQPQPAGRWPDDYHESNPTLLSDGREVLFQRGGWGDWSILRLHLASGTETLEATDAQQPSVSADGRWLGFTRRPAAHKGLVEYDWDVVPQVWLLDRNSGNQWRLPHSIGGAELPAVSPDGRSIAWLQFDHGRTEVVVHDIAALTAEPPTVVGLAASPAAADAAAATADSTAGADNMAPFDVVLETTAGNIVLTVHPEWAPTGAAHFRELVEAGFYDGAPWFRVIPGFVAQAGIAADNGVNKQWSERNIQDEPVRQGNTRGRVSYGMSGQPNSRSTHIFINYGDNSRLDEMGFAAFAEVSEGMEIAANLHAIPDDAFARRGMDQGGLAEPGGTERFRQLFPEADWITRAYVR